MIRNIIFDLGNVLISFRPKEYLDKKEYSEEAKKIILEDIFHAKEWIQLDNGDISLSEAIDSIAGKSSMSREEITHIFNLRTDLMVPLDQNINLLPELKEMGFKLFFLSNFPIDIFHEIQSGYYFFKYFDGGIISAEVRHSKPDSKIYQILMEKYSIIPEESLFIDDLEANVHAAEKLGMKGLVTHGSLEIEKEVKNALSGSF
jgi:putative hydrolase of the HAD superfamily